jgi:hypothetical protein
VWPNCRDDEQPPSAQDRHRRPSIERNFQCKRRPLDRRRRTRE